MTGAETFEAVTGWAWQDGELYVNAADLIALLREGDYDALADTFERIVAEETAEHEAGHRAP